MNELTSKGAAMGEEMRNCMYAEADEGVKPVSRGLSKLWATCSDAAVAECMLLAGIAWLIWGRA
jgi:hypothetical protein